MRPYNIVRAAASCLPILEGQHIAKGYFGPFEIPIILFVIVLHNDPLSVVMKSRPATGPICWSLKLQVGGVHGQRPSSPNCRNKFRRNFTPHFTKPGSKLLLEELVSCNVVDNRWLYSCLAECRQRTVVQRVGHAVARDRLDRNLRWLDGATAKPRCHVFDRLASKLPISESRRHALLAKPDFRWVYCAWGNKTLCRPFQPSPAATHWHFQAYVAGNLLDACVQETFAQRRVARKKRRRRRRGSGQQHYQGQDGSFHGSHYTRIEKVGAGGGRP